MFFCVLRFFHVLIIDHQSQTKHRSRKSALFRTEGLNFYNFGNQLKENIGTEVLGQHFLFKFKTELLFLFFCWSFVFLHFP